MTTDVIDGLDGVQTYMDGISASFTEADYTDELHDFLRLLEDRHRHYFASRTSPSGDSWPPLAPSTVRRKGHDTILVDTGRLKGSLKGESGDSIREVYREGANNQHGLVFGTAVPYSIFHDGGGRLPKRQHVGMDDDTLHVLVDAVADISLEAMKGS